MPENVHLASYIAIFDRSPLAHWSDASPWEPFLQADLPPAGRLSQTLSVYGLVVQPIHTSLSRMPPVTFELMQA